MTSKDQIVKNLSYHAGKPGPMEKAQALRAKAIEFAFLVDDLCPNSREKALAQTKIEEAVMWSLAAIARNQ